MKKNYKFLNNINFPSDIKKLSHNELKTLSQEVRDEMIDAVSETGGHLGAGLGVVELTVVLHYIFNTPNDKLIWDVGHQTYPHKILTGRKDKLRTLRKNSELNGPEWSLKNDKRVTKVGKLLRKYNGFGMVIKSTQEFVKIWTGWLFCCMQFLS